MFWKTNVIVAIGAAVFGGLFLVQTPRSESGPEIKIGFVNLFKVRSLSKKHAGLIRKLDAEKKRMETKIREDKMRIQKRAREELPLYERGTPEAETLERELLIEEYRIKIEEKSTEAKLRRQHMKLADGYVQDLQKVVGDYGRKNGYTVILLCRDTFRVNDTQDLISVNSWWVLYHDAALDVTDEIVKIMNQE